MHVRNRLESNIGMHFFYQIAKFHTFQPTIYLLVNYRFQLLDILLVKIVGEYTLLIKVIPGALMFKQIQTPLGVPGNCPGMEGGGCLS